MVIALVFLFGAVFPLRVAWWAVEFVGQVGAVLFSVAFKVHGDAVAGLALELGGGTGVVGAVFFIGIFWVQAVLVHVAEETGRDAAVVGAFEFRLGAGAVARGAGGQEFV